MEEYNRGALRHQKHFVPHTDQTSVYQARPTANFDGASPVYQARPTANFDGEPVPTYHARPSHQTQAEAVHIPEIPSYRQLESGRTRSEGRNPNNFGHDTQTAITHVGPEILSYMQKILASGNHLSIEYANQDKFSKGEWQRFSTHEIDDMADAIGDLERCLVAHNEDYVRVAGIDYKTKQPVMGTVIQNPNEKNSGSTFRYPPTPTYPNKQLQGDSTFRYPPTAKLAPSEQSSGSSFRYPPTPTPYSNQLNSGFDSPKVEPINEQSTDSTFHYPPTPTEYSEQIGGSTFHYPPTAAPHYSEQSSDSTFHYPPAAKTYNNEQGNDSTFHYPPTKTYHNDSTFRYPPTTTVTPFPAPHTSVDNYTARTNTGTSQGNQYNAQVSSAHVALETLEQMREILASGNHIGIEYVDQRRFSTGSWKSYAGHQIEDMADAIATLEACLVEHNNDYVRIFAIEPQAKRRLTEIMVQRPDGQIVRR
ncbi:ribulose bisphosphate carboxylase small subunit [Rivularia sp. UHCC 0363]|uniref:ribulose bisphosphate carboxylase small subunit n=1 Tax=Rivularia sp. UHCC 0363 TaxID=3110244 RepID=UPI002B21F72F|nr:ribulose bisphosphate carboxylase small subunit [Rivularia sp. UHCC 0363]MEA5592995.1 ribulose bisphosphate carboxylase small subunit [Rivularia sp. UHCC 0363]